MKRLIIICEGPTEYQFSNQSLRPHFLSKEIDISTPYPKWSGGGDIDWNKLKVDINLHLKSDRKAFVTTFIDLYGLSKPSNYPRWEEAEKANGNIFKKVEILEKAILESIDDDLRYRLIPNFVIHEFEGLLFNDISFFDDLLELNEYKDRSKLISTIDRYVNPELINDSPQTAPSKRLENNFLKNYVKTDFGVRLAVNIGLNNIRTKCLHFDEWITKLENI